MEVEDPEPDSEEEDPEIDESLVIGIHELRTILDKINN